ncbi:MAG TPA: alpha/beta fold hydrolase [Actinomycetota bacterium]|nr:alpha/beta fold hydrolase [Actinomycetota bacterium]
MRALLVESDGMSLSAGIVVGPQPRAAVVLCHGIPGSARRDPRDEGYGGLARVVAGRGYAAAWLDFRGVRDSPGDFSAAGWIRDLEAMLDALSRDREAAGLPVVAAGSSAGGAIAIAAAARRPDVAAVATLATPASLRLLADDPATAIARLRNLGIIRDPAFPRDPAAWWDEIDELSSDRHVAAIAPRPLLIAHGDADDVVPYAHAEKLYAAAGYPKELARLPGAGHQLRKDERGIACLLDWLDRLKL